MAWCLGFMGLGLGLGLAWSLGQASQVIQLAGLPCENRFQVAAASYADVS